MDSHMLVEQTSAKAVVHIHVSSVFLGGWLSREGLKGVILHGAC